MAFVPIGSYEVDWNQKLNKYRINVWATAAGPSDPPLTLDISSETEFIAVLLMLSKSDVSYDGASGDIHRLRRPVGT
jgi:hypothetical protein